MMSQDKGHGGLIIKIILYSSKLQGKKPYLQIKSTGLCKNESCCGFFKDKKREVNKKVCATLLIVMKQVSQNQIFQEK